MPRGSPISICVESQLELLQSMELLAAARQHSVAVSLLLDGDSALYKRDLEIYSQQPWGESPRSVCVPARAGMGVMERMLSEQRPGVAAVFQTPSRLSIAAARLNLSTFRIPQAKLLRLTLARALKEARRRVDLGLVPDVNPAGYILAAISQEGPPKLTSRRLVSTLQTIADRQELPVIWPATAFEGARFIRAGSRGALRLVSAPDILDWLNAASQARLILTDQTDVQVTACLLQVPCVTLLEETEVPETVHAGANILAGAKPEEIQLCAGIMARKLEGWRDPFADDQDAGLPYDLGGLDTTFMARESQ